MYCLKIRKWTGQCKFNAKQIKQIVTTNALTDALFLANVKQYLSYLFSILCSYPDVDRGKKDVWRSISNMIEILGEF